MREVLQGRSCDGREGYEGYQGWESHVIPGLSELILGRPGEIIKEVETVLEMSAVREKIFRIRDGKETLIVDFLRHV